jgi:hypothetical protein
VFGTKGYREKPDGSWTLDGGGTKKQADAWREMTEPVRRLQIDRGEKVQGRQETVTVRRPDGSLDRVAARYEGLAASSGSTAVVRYGGLRVIRAPDGLLYRETRLGNRWECTGKRRLTEDVIAPGKVGVLIEVD